MFTPFPKEEHVPYQPKQEEHAKSDEQSLWVGSRILQTPGSFLLCCRVEEF
jgi:hypothetical protein